MKKIIIILILIILLPSVISYEATLQDARCNKNGMLWAKVKLTGESDSQKCSEIELNRLENVTLYCYDKNMAEATVYPFSSSKKTHELIVTTDEQVFNLSEELNVDLEFKGDYVDIIEKCPGYFFSCDDISISADNCYTMDNVFYTIFTVTGEGSESILARNDIDFQINYKISSGYAYYDAPSARFKVRKLTGNRYIFEDTFSSTIESIRLMLRDCEVQKKFSYESCTDYLPCSTDEDCIDENLYCDGSRCAKLSCSSCEIVSDHKCLPKNCNDNNDCTEDYCEQGSCKHDKEEGCCVVDISCDDANACTTDTCTDNSCVYTDVVCEEKNCSSVECVPDQGCVYTEIESCGEVQQSESFFSRFFSWLKNLFS